MNISAVILNWNSKKHLKRAIPSLVNSLENSGCSYEIFVVDNGSTDGSVKYLDKLRERQGNIIIPIYLEHNMGTTYSRNLALKRAQGDYVAVLDSDVEVPNGIFEHLSNRLGAINDVGLIAPRLLYPSGRLQKSTDVFPTVTRKIVRFFFLKWIERRDQRDEHVGVSEVDYAISAFWLLPNDVLQHVGLLDEAIFYAPEDVDYCLRIRKKGLKIIYDPTVSAIHHAQEISRGFKLNKATVEHVKGLVYYYRKHRHFLRPPKL